MADVYRRTGRGGAGNFYSQKDIAEATKAADSSKDLEAQKQQQQPPPADEIPTDPADAPAQNATLAPGAYARTGRGGAGNFVDPVSVATAQASSTSASSPPTSPTSSSTPAPAVVARSGLSGRGGAGNWTTVPGEGQEGEEGEGGVYDPEQERKRREALDAHILKDIRDSLPQPPKIHYMHGPGRGRKPEPSPATS